MTLMNRCPVHILGTNQRTGNISEGIMMRRASRTGIVAHVSRMRCWKWCHWIFCTYYQQAKISWHFYHNGIWVHGPVTPWAIGDRFPLDRDKEEFHRYMYLPDIWHLCWHHRVSSDREPTLNEHPVELDLQLDLQLDLFLCGRST